MRYNFSMTDATQLDLARLHSLLTVSIPPVHYTPQTGSTNTDLVAAAAAGAPAWQVHLTDEQTSGHGRHGRKWHAPFGTQNIVSMLVRPPATTIERLGTLPLACGLAIRAAVAETTDLAVNLKWPNDVLINGKKLCGMLAEAQALGEAPAIIVGIGLNVHLTEKDLPVPHATSLLLATGDFCDRTTLLAAEINHLYRYINQWINNDPVLLEEYRTHCSSIGQEVRVHLPSEEDLLGTCCGVAPDGNILVRDAAGTIHSLSAGDVTHLRLKDGSRG